MILQHFRYNTCILRSYRLVEILNRTIIRVVSHGCIWKHIFPHNSESPRNSIGNIPWSRSTFGDLRKVHKTPQPDTLRMSNEIVQQSVILALAEEGFGANFLTVDVSGYHVKAQEMVFSEDVVG
jgi:hypothetical protein